MADIEIFGAKELSADLTQAATHMLPAVREITRASGIDLRDGWRTNAKATAGKHGRRYPSAITSDDGPATYGAAVVDVGPETGKAQGGMGRGFELGSVNQPPHLDGKRAADVVEPKYASLLEAYAAGIL